MKKESYTVILFLTLLLLFWIYDLHQDYKTRNSNIIEFSLICIDDGYHEVHEDKYFSLNPFDYFLINRAVNRNIWISEPTVFNSFSDYVVSVRVLKDSKNNVTRSYNLKRNGDYFYYEVYGEEFDYSVKVKEAQNANLDCAIIDYWIKDNY